MRILNCPSDIVYMFGALFTTFFFVQAEDGIRVGHVTGVQTCALPISAIDGPADHSLYPANLSATLGAADPDQVAAEILEALRRALPEDAAGQLRGCAVMDARDSVRRVSGSHADKSDEFFEQA